MHDMGKGFVDRDINEVIDDRLEHLFVLKRVDRRPLRDPYEIAHIHDDNGCEFQKIGGGNNPLEALEEGEVFADLARILGAEMVHGVVSQKVDATEGFMGFKPTGEVVAMDFAGGLVLFSLEFTPTMVCAISSALLRLSYARYDLERHCEY